jgi:uncharacterized protein with FMN-binding domain
MKSRRWHGALLYLAILTATSGVYGLRIYASEHRAALTSSPPPAVRSGSGRLHASRPGSSNSSKKSSPAASQTVTGATEQTQYGPVQVAVTFAGKRITDVRVLQTPDQDGRSRDIAARAVPALHDEVIASQSAHIDTVSGATYTSDGYAQSVQSAIDRLGGG